MYPQWYVVCGWQEGVAYGSKQVLWRRKCIYDSIGRGKQLILLSYKALLKGF